MKFDIIETDYIKNMRRFSPYFRIIAIIALVFLFLEYISDDFFIKNKIISIISTSIICIYFILEILNAILFSRIGFIKFGNNKIVINKINNQSEFLLSNIQNVQISKVQSKHFLIKAKPSFEEIIELNENDLTKLEEYFNINQINCQTKSINNWIKKKFGRKNVA